DPQNLPSVVNTVAGAMNADMPVSDPTDNSSGDLAKGGAFVAFLDGEREFEITFTSSNQYEFRYRDNGGSWQFAGTGNRNDDAIFADAGGYVLEHWWSGSTSAGDTFRYTANPDAGMVPTPVIFWGSNGNSGFAAAYTNNHVNLLSGLMPDGTATAYTPLSFGPEVNYRGLGNESLFDNYVADSLADAGYDNTVFADARVYHNGIGSIHCGTNVIREVPDESFWA
ncbi:MAG: protein-arginine deiminase family protein, partial [Planctomycetota bacterium]